MPDSPSHRRGSTLMLVLVFMFILGTTMAALVQAVNGYLDREISRHAGFRAYQLALSGLAIGMEAEIPADDALLRQQINDQERFEVTFESENRRININGLLLSNDQAVLERLFLEWGLDRVEAGTLIDRLIDWVDPDSLKKLNGAEEIDYMNLGRRGQPRNGAFQSLEEMGQVMGMERLTELRPDWRKYFTVWVNSQLDVMEADPAVLVAFLDVSIEQAEDFAAYRQGDDGIIHTEDDPVFESVEQVLAYMGTGTADEELLAKLTLDASSRRIVSTGHAGTTTHTIEVIVPVSENIQRQNIVWLKL
jgi:type II secretory pathway component PulK